MDCKETLEQLADFLDEEAREELCRAIEQHLTQCRDCRVYVDTVKKTIILAHNMDGEVDVPASAISRLENALAQEYQRAAAGDHPRD